MWRLGLKRLLWILGWTSRKIGESVLVVVVLCYVVLVLDIYVNTERLSKVSPTLNTFCQKIASNPNFTKGPVVFRVDRGTLVYRLNLYISRSGLAGYAPFFIFPHHRTVILVDAVLKEGNLIGIVAHELGHIQGGIKHFGSVKEMEQCADSFAAKIIETQR